MNLYITADKIGTETGGGLVTYHESEALKELGPCVVWDCPSFIKDSIRGTFVAQADTKEPWYFDAIGATKVKGGEQLAHFYAGTFGKTVKRLKESGCRVSYTIAAHDRAISRGEHESLGLPFPYPHLTDDGLWQRYIEGYRLADVIICPSSVAAKTVRAYGPEFCSKDIRIIPHGCTLPANTVLPPTRFTVGYMGSFGADKGVRYLLEAWKRLDYKDAILVLAGSDSLSPWCQHLIQRFGGGTIVPMGWVKDVSGLYNNISLYVQPSATEGFGIEMVEAMAHARPVICSDGAGAVDLVEGDQRCIACDVGDLMQKIDYFKNRPYVGHQIGEANRKKAEDFTWPKIRRRYQDLWQELLQSSSVVV